MIRNVEPTCRSMLVGLMLYQFIHKHCCMYDVHKTYVCRKLRALWGFRPVEQVKTCRQQWKKVSDILNRNHQLWFIIPTTTIFLTISTSSSSTSQQQLIIITIIIGCIALVLVSQLHGALGIPRDVYGSCTIDASIVELTFIVWPQRCRDATWCCNEPWEMQYVSHTKKDQPDTFHWILVV